MGFQGGGEAANRTGVVGGAIFEAEDARMNEPARFVVRAHARQLDVALALKKRELHRAPQFGAGLGRASRGRGRRAAVEKSGAGHWGALKCWSRANAAREARRTWDRGLFGEGGRR